jgi:hypothetical protein
VVWRSPWVVGGTLGGRTAPGVVGGHPGWSWASWVVGVTLGGLEVTLGGVGAPGVLVLKGMSPLKRLNLAKPQLGGAGGFALLRNKTA